MLFLLSLIADLQQAGTSGTGQKHGGVKAQVSIPETKIQVTRSEAQNIPRILRAKISSPQSSVPSTSKSLLLSSLAIQQIQGTKKSVVKKPTDILIAQKPAVAKIQASITGQNIILRAVTQPKPSTTTATLQATIPQHVQSSGTKIVIPPELLGKGQRLFFKQVSQSVVPSPSQNPVTNLTQGGKMISFTPQISALKSENMALRKSANSAASSNVSLLKEQYVLVDTVTETQKISPSSSTSKVQSMQATKDSPKVTPLAPPKKRKQTLVATNPCPVKKMIIKKTDQKTQQKKHQIQLFTQNKPVQLPKIPTSEVAKPKVPLIQKQRSLLLSAQKTSKSVQKETAPAPVRPQRNLRKRLAPLAPAEPEEAAKKPRLLAPKPYVPVAMMCRLCGENIHDMIAIFSVKGTKLGLAEKISLHLPIEVSSKDLQLSH